MAKLALYQKYRSSNFDEVVGQEYIVRSIQNAVRENKVGHAYLFCGPRGTGKTTMARLLAKAVNCENQEQAPCETCANCVAAIEGTHPDIIEINAANETHVEDIRDLIERSTLAPMMGKHKVYIIDEVHQLSSAASSALLKTLEEPPANVIFILATTDPQKLLPTIISRCQRFDFTKVRQDLIQKHLLNIAEMEHMEMEPEAAAMIAVLCDGGMRDALSIMDQCASFTQDHITVEAIDRIYGLESTDEKIAFIQSLTDQNIADITLRTESYEKKGIDLQRYTDDLITILKDTVIYSQTKKEELLKLLNKAQAAGLTEKISDSKCLQFCNALMDAKQKYKTTQNVTLIFEITCLSMSVNVEEPQVVVSRETIQEPRPAFRPVPTVKDPGLLPKKGLEEPPVIEKKVDPTMIETIRKVDTNMILSLLVQCDKQSKVSDENTFAMLKAYQDLNNRKYITLLEETKIAASGKDCILLIAKQNALANRINAEKMNEELYFFMKDTMHTDKVIFATTTEEFGNATKAFIEARKTNTLPQPMQIQRYVKEIVQEKTPEEKAIELFGEENIEII